MAWFASLEGVHIEPGLFPVLIIAELAHFVLEMDVWMADGSMGATDVTRRLLLAKMPARQRASSLHLGQTRREQLFRIPFGQRISRR